MSRLINIVKERGAWEAGFWRAGLGNLTLLVMASLGRVLYCKQKGPNFVFVL